MPSPFREPKSLAESLQLDYYRRPRGVRRLRSWLGWPTLIGCLVLVGATFWPRARFVYQAHPVSPAHALFNNNCEVCHEKSFVPASRLINGGEQLTSVEDATCVKCHEGPPHQPSEVTPNPPRCASCHPEHRGKTEMARVSDRRCTDCHSDLTFQDGHRSQVTAFRKGEHPDFRKIEHTGSKINFNHKLHLALPQQKSLQDANSPAMTEALQRIEKDSCQFCHKTDAAGEYMRPITFEEHCKVCHPLNVYLFEQPRSSETLAFMQIQAPHKEPAIVRDSLRQRLVDFLQNGAKNMEAAPTAGVLPQFSPRKPMEDRSDWVHFQLSGNESLLFSGANGCRYCHTVEQPYDPETGRLPKYANSGIVYWWYRDSHFSHRSHQMLECSQCHDNAMVKDLNQVVQIPGKELCLQCHQKSSRPWQEIRVRSDCVDCHRYHKHSGQDFRGTFTITDCTRPR